MTTGMNDGGNTEGRTPLAEVLEYLPGVAEMLPKPDLDLVDSKPEADADEEEETEGNENPDVESEEDADGDEADEAEDGEDKDQGDEIPKLDARTQAKIQKRIDKAVAREKAAEERAAEAAKRVTELEERLAGEKPVMVAPTATDPLADVESVEELDKRMRGTMAWKSWAIRNPDGGEVPMGDGKTREVAADEVREILANAEEMLQLHIPQRARYLNELTRHEAEAREAYPALFDSRSEEAVRANALLKAWPEVKRFPDWRTVLGDYMAGVARRAEMKAKNGEEKTKVKPKLAPPVPKVSASKPKAASERKQGPSLDRLIESGGNVDALMEYFEQADA